MQHTHILVIESEERKEWASLSRWTVIFLLFSHYAYHTTGQPSVGVGVDNVQLIPLFCTVFSSIFIVFFYPFVYFYRLSLLICGCFGHLSLEFTISAFSDAENCLNCLEQMWTRFSWFRWRKKCGNEEVRETDWSSFLALLFPLVHLQSILLVNSTRFDGCTLVFV